MNTDPCYYRVSVKGLVRDGQGKIMLILQDDGYWELPGGGLEYDEDPKACLAREVLEDRPNDHERGAGAEVLSDGAAAWL